MALEKLSTHKQQSDVHNVTIFPEYGILILDAVKYAETDIE